MKLPASTLLALRIPQAAIYGIAAGLAAAALAMQWLIKPRSGAVVFHAGVLVLVFFLYVLYREAMLAPIAKVLMSVQGTG